ncbi:Spherulation-specific family 4-domain-containing protein [Parachaetomium inaequale]|uniref:Spherulation-specific family 4-domain-containing protein n=1 Tax=Parachaetomium inaequale TaxID=2588326 RepID=A0AAN6PIB5_9PEZI|nr:Spherulation-specific family 4-domain-containing protein [Parachaetomium inaequale]
MKPTLLTLAATATATELLLPLYQFPANNGGAWAPIEAALTANPSLTAKVIINPSNGPGGPNQGIEDPQYAAGTKALAAHANAQLIGCVHTSTDGGQTRCNMPYANITADIRKWATWVDAGVAIRGIFIDEAPANTANDCVNYMRNLTTFIRTDPDLTARFGARPIVVYNPGGTGTLQPYYDLQPDLIVALETCFTVQEHAGGDYDQCSAADVYERYDHDGVGSSIDNVLFPNIGQANAARTAVLVHGFHHFNGPAANLSATDAVLEQLIRGVVQRGVGATFFNTAGYHTFTDGPASIGRVMEVLSAANAA